MEALCLCPIPKGAIGLAAPDTSDVLLEPVKRSRIYEHIVEQIHALIREGRWAPGDQIPPERGQRELAEVLEVRELIEPGIARLAATRATSEHVSELEHLLERQQDCIANGRPFVDEDTAFHYTLARAADNHILLRLHNVVLDVLRESRQSYLHVPDRPQTSLRGHEAILAAVRAHEPEAAYTASLAHI